MTSEYRDNSLRYWDGIHAYKERSDIKTDDWLYRFDDIITACNSPVLDLGCGGGNDTLYLIERGKKVISCDQSPKAIQGIIKNFPDVYDVRCFNMLDGFPFEDEAFEIVIADLCLHYFTEDDTRNILNEINRILVNGGHLIFRVNSMNDINHGAGQGKEIEHHLFETESHTIKRFFNEDDIRDFFKDFEIEFLNEEIMTRYSLEKRLFTGCVRKKIPDRG